MGLPAGFRDVSVPAAAAFLPDLHPAGAILQAPPAWDAWAAVPPDAAADAALPALAAVLCVEKLAAPAPDVLAPTVEALPRFLLPTQSEALCKLDAGRSVA